MRSIWQQESACIREIMIQLPAPRPHYNSVATIVKVLVRKGFLSSQLVGNTHLYRPIIDFETYREEALMDVQQKYFEDSLPKMLAHFAKSEKLSVQDKEALIAIIQSSDHE